MYTECYICSPIKTNTPKEIMDILFYMFGDKDLLDEAPKNLPAHKFFTKERWQFIGKCSSFYHIPFSVSKIRKEQNQYYLVSRSDIKNYDNEIEGFFDWISPYLDKYEGDFIGYSRYEEVNKPKLYFMKKRK